MQCFSTFFVPRPITTIQYNLTTPTQEFRRPIVMNVSALVSGRRSSRAWKAQFATPPEKARDSHKGRDPQVENHCFNE